MIGTIRGECCRIFPSIYLLIILSDIAGSIHHISTYVVGSKWEWAFAGLLIPFAPQVSDLPDCLIYAGLLIPFAPQSQLEVELQLFGL